MRVQVLFTRSIFCALFALFCMTSAAQDAKYYKTQGDGFYNKKDYAQAINSYTQAINTDPNYADAYNMRGVSMLNQDKKQVDQAIADFNQALRIAPNFVGAHNNLAWAYDIKNLPKESVQEYSIAISLDPNTAVYWARRGNILYKMTDYCNATLDFTRSIQLDPDKDEYWNSRARAYLKKNDFDSAVLDLDEAIRLKPESSNYYNNRGLAYSNLGEYDEAISDFRVSMEKDPKNSLPYINIFSPLVREEKYNDALGYYQTYKQKGLKSYLESDKFKFYQHYISAVSKVQTNDLDGALNELDGALNDYGNEIKDESRRSYIDIMTLYAHIYELQQQYEDALDLYDQSLTIDPFQPDVDDAKERVSKMLEKAANDDKAGPEIRLINPAQGETVLLINGSKLIYGKASDPSGISAITVNGMKVKNIEEDGMFTIELKLAPGNNTLSVSATDKQENTAEAKFSITAMAAPANENATRGGEVKNMSNSEVAQTASAAGNYYAIFIANENYNETDWRKLANPVSDAVKFRELLVSKYTFDPKNVDTLFNRTRSEMLIAISKKVRKMGKNDNLLIFYAGHGKAVKNDDGSVDGYLIPTDGNGEMPTWVSTNDLKSVLKAPAGSPGAKHILFVSDACFSGALTRGGQMTASPGIQRQMEKKSRTAMTSGNLEEVPDISMFLKYLMQSLDGNTSKFLTASDLFSDFKDAVINNTKNIPLCRAIQDVGDEGGEFVFIKR